MCTYSTERIELSGSGKGAGGWFPNSAMGASARVAVELDERSAAALAAAITAALAADG